MKHMMHALFEIVSLFLGLSDLKGANLSQALNPHFKRGKPRSKG